MSGRAIECPSRYPQSAPGEQLRPKTDLLQHPDIIAGAKSARSAFWQLRCNDINSLHEKMSEVSHTPQAAITIIQGHRQTENSLHWSPNVVMNDDQHRTRKGHAPANFAALRRIELNIIKANTAKESNCGKFKKASWSDDFPKTLIQGF
ncbi:MAG: hypothetical protein OXC62_08730 [Aestuariivita sp.]|nr:hypothetical protein [Aestuariivita sp.]